MNLANAITLGRLLSVPIPVYLLMQSAYTAAFLVFLLAGASDALDGYLAKKHNQATQIGAMLDPLADKALLVGVYVTLGLQEILADWLVVLVVSRDVMIVGGVILLFLARLDVKMRPLVVSKINTAAQIGLAAFVLAQLGFTQLGLAFGSEWLESALIYLVAATTMISGASYVVAWTRQMAGTESTRRL